MNEIYGKCTRCGVLYEIPSEPSCWATFRNTEKMMLVHNYCDSCRKQLSLWDRGLADFVEKGEQKE